MTKDIREQLQQETKEYLEKIDFVKVHSEIKMSDASQDILFKWISEREYLTRRKYYHQYWYKALWAERSYRLSKEHREEMARYQQLILGMDLALECAGYEILADGWIEGEGKFKNIDFITYVIVSKFKRGF